MIGESIIRSGPRALHGILRHWFPVMTRYRSSLSATPILLFVASRRWDGFLLTGRTLGWRRFTTGDVTHVFAGTDNLSQIRDPGTATEIARVDSGHMRECAAFLFRST